MNDTSQTPEPMVAPPGQERRVDAHLILALGVISVVACPLTGPLAWVMGNQVLAQVPEADLGEAAWKAVRTGRLLGIYGTVGMLALLLMVPVLYLLYFHLVEQFSQW